MWTAPFSTSFFSRNKHVEIEVNPGLRFHFKMYGGFLSKLNHSNILRINRVERNEDRGTNVKCFPHFIASLLRLICWLLTRHRGGFQPLKLSLTSPSRHQLSWQPVLMIDLDMKCAAFLHISTPFFPSQTSSIFSRSGRIPRAIMSFEYQYYFQKEIEREVLKNLFRVQFFSLFSCQVRSGIDHCFLQGYFYSLWLRYYSRE